MSPSSGTDSSTRDEVRQAAARVLASLPPPAQASAVTAWRATRRRRRHFAEAMGRSRYSRPALNDLDRKLQAYLPPSGCFVEAGANDGFQQSNTYFLERFRGWTGILIEPIPALARRAAKERRVPVVNAALVSPSAHGHEIALRSAGLVSSIGGGESAHTDFGSDGHVVTVQGQTLSSILSEHRVDRVDLLSLDVEGHEAEVLSGIDFDLHAPRLILVEIDAQREAVESVLGPRYRLVDRLSFHDYLYTLVDEATTAARGG